MEPRAFRTRHLLLAAPFALVVACAPAEEAEEAAPEVEEAAVPSPDTTAVALWAHLEAAEYRENWSLWPDKGRLYEGTEPHGMLLTTYLNPVAHDALTNRAGRFSDGAIIVKENYGPDSTFAAATVMYKASGYDPEHNDWFWLKRNADGTVDAAGRDAMCIACHSGGADNDYILTGPIR